MSAKSLSQRITRRHVRGFMLTNLVLAATYFMTPSSGPTGGAYSVLDAFLVQPAAAYGCQQICIGYAFCDSAPGTNYWCWETSPTACIGGSDPSCDP